MPMMRLHETASPLPVVRWDEGKTSTVYAYRVLQYRYVDAASWPQPVDACVLTPVKPKKGAMPLAAPITMVYLRPDRGTPAR